MFSGLGAILDESTNLQRMAGNLDLVFVISSEDEDTVVTLRNGRLESVSSEPSLMTNAAFRMQAPRESWEKFLQPAPEPGFHDILAMTRSGGMRFSGDMQRFVSCLLFLKFWFAALRAKGAQS